LLIMAPSTQSGNEAASVGGLVMSALQRRLSIIGWRLILSDRSQYGLRRRFTS
jgi:hypothetical protein